MKNYRENHMSGSLNTVYAEDAARSRYAINWMRESGLKVKLKSVCYDNHIYMDMSPEDTYQVAFYKYGKKTGGFVVNSGSWAAISNATGDKPILHLIPKYIAGKGYDAIAILPIKGDGAYSAANVKTANLDEIPRGTIAKYNIIDFEIKQLEIEIKAKAFEKIQKKRDEALKVGILSTEDSDVVPAKVRAEGGSYSAELRLKGDWTDHLASDKWSFRIEVKGDYCVYNMQKFSIQPPATRNYISEYLIYECYRDQGGVALRYDFTDVYINGEYKGVYALEEFMEKRVIEHSQKREGPIVKYDENTLFWEYLVNYIPSFGVEKTTNFTVFSEKKTLASAGLSGYAQYAIDQMNKVLDGDTAIEDVFDLDLYSKYFVILDAFRASHGRDLINNRHYYNPVTAKIEPIPFDELAGFNSSYLALKPYGQIDTILRNYKSFRQLYKKYALQYMEDGYDAFIGRHMETVRQYETTIRRDESDFKCDTSFVAVNMKNIKTFLTAERTMPAADILLKQTDDGERYSLKITNRDSAPIVVTGLADDTGKQISADVFPATIGCKEAADAVRELKFAAPPLNIDKLTMTYEFYYEEGERKTHVAPLKSPASKRYCFGVGTDDFGYIKSGFSGQENGFRWTEGDIATLVFNTREMDERDMIAEFTISPFLSGALREQRVGVFVNGIHVNNWAIDAPATKELLLSKEQIKGETMTIEFKLPDAASPKELGMNEDGRKLAVAFREILFKPVYSQPVANILMKPTDAGKRYNLKITNRASVPIVVTGLTDGADKQIAAESFPVKIGAETAADAVFELEFTASSLNIGKLDMTYEFITKKGEQKIRVKRHDFSFWAVGHVYGSPGDSGEEPYPPFAGLITDITSNQRMDFGVLMGDIVRGPSSSAYGNVARVMADTRKPYYAIPGNHDEGDGGILFEKTFGQRYHNFSRNDNLFLLLDPEMKENGVGGGDQMKMILRALEDLPTVKNIFIFTHELIWLDRNNPKMNYFAPNSWQTYTPLMPQCFREVLLPALSKTGANIYCVAGDSGAFDNGMQIFYEVIDGVTYISTGLGSKTKDNLLQFDITTDGEVFIRLIALNGENRNALGHVERFARNRGDHNAE
ncbi:hypothetical protein FACS1894216_14070 [Synergistales bacterium]|nr:hypothetical protein FACS1894216_14070 [Synergistales bacterium]